MPQKRDSNTGRYVANGGAYVDEQGYPRISCGPCRGQRIHRAKAAVMLGRELNPNTDVHHRGEKHEFSDSKLQIMSHGAHSSLTAYERKRMKQEDEFLRKKYEEIYGAGFDCEGI
jgi:hypothetical protein